MAFITQLTTNLTGWGGILFIAALMTVAITLSALAIGAVFGSLVAWAKLAGNWPARIVGEAYTTLFRGVPELLIIYLVYFGGSHAVTAIGAYFGADGFLGLPSFLAGALAVGVISGSYQSEVFRGAFQSIAKGEIEAARAVGMPPFLLFRRVIAPQVLRFALPGLGNVLQLSLKDSALVSVTGLAELMRTSQIAAGSTRQYFFFYIFGAALYLVMTSLADRIFGKAEAHVAKSFRGGVGRN